MSKFHVNQIRKLLEQEFKDLIDLSDKADATADQQKDAFLTRSLAAYALVLAADVSPSEAAAHVIDGFDDNGIDALLFDAGQHRLYVVQSKWSHEGNSTPELGDVHKFLQGFTDLLEAKYGKFNGRFSKVQEEAWAAVQDPQGRFTLVLAYTGLQGVSAHAQQLIDGELAAVNDTSVIATFVPYAQKELHGSIASRIEGAPINLDDLVLFDWGKMDEPLAAFYGKCAASDVAAWFKAHGDRLFAKNLRKIIGSSEINKEITESLLRAPDQFWYLNNGITVVCQSVIKKPVGGSDRSTGHFACTGISVVNGAQTVGAIARAFEIAPEKVTNAKVGARFIQCSAEFAVDVTRAANTQNRIESKDFAALDPNQQRLWTELMLDKKEYAYRTGEEPPTPERGCTIEEATIALACAHGDVSFAVIAKSAIGRFWSDIKKPPYTVLFNPSVTGARLWRTVEVLRAVEAALVRVTNDAPKKEALVAVHGNRFIANQVYKRLPQGAVADTTKPIEPVLSEARELTPVLVKQSADELTALYPKAYLQSLFKNAAKCKELDSKLQAPPVATQPLLFPTATPE